jgi:hypothetical protein
MVVTPNPEKIPGQPPWLDMNCHYPGAYNFSFSYVVAGVTYVSAVNQAHCSNRPWP